MMVIEQSIYSSSQSTGTAQANLELPLSSPLHLSGRINTKALFSPDNQSQSGEFEFEIGVDEVGRGPLYGSVVVAAVILPKAWSGETEVGLLQDTPLAILTDSKKLTERKREKLFEPVKQHALAYLIVEVPAGVIDEINILQATILGMRVACEQLMVEITKVWCDASELPTAPSTPLGFKLLIDGNKVPDLDEARLATHGICLADMTVTQPAGMVKFCAEAWVKGDARHNAIAAASVLAKVYRDRQLIADGARYPGYGLEGHKGYPTKAHVEAIARLGVLPEHRRSFKPVQQAIEGTLADTHYS